MNTDVQNIIKELYREREEYKATAQDSRFALQTREHEVLKLIRNPHVDVTTPRVLSLVGEIRALKKALDGANSKFHQLGEAINALEVLQS